MSIATITWECGKVPVSADSYLVWDGYIKIWTWDGTTWLDANGAARLSPKYWAAMPASPNDSPNKLGPIECDILDELRCRLTKGQESYGSFAAKDPRDWKIEARDELLDALVYVTRSLWRMR